MPPEHDSRNDLCPQCGKEPGRPKFCSRSCAAKFNNRRSPKRRPEGKCEDCGVAIPTKQKRCAACAAKKTEVERRIAENIQLFRSLDGAVREIAVKKAWVHDTVVFDSAGSTFKTSDPCGDFLDNLLGIVFARPAYIRADDIHRYAAWIDAFRSHVIDGPWGMYGGSRLPVAKVPLRDLGHVLRHWVDTVIWADNHALFPTFALDAARFIDGHAFGYHRYGRERWSISGLVTQPPNDERMMRDRLNDPQLKHEITRRLKGTLTRCVVPIGGNFPGETAAQPLLGQGEEFLFEVERCHLTQQNYYDHSCRRAVEEGVPKFDVADEMWFRGAIPLDPTTLRPMRCLADTDPSWRWKSCEMWSEIPIRWISDVYMYEKDDNTLQPIPLPRWAV